MLDLRHKAAAAVRRLGEIDESELPPFIIPARNFILKVANLYFDIKTDVMDFYNVMLTLIIIGFSS